MFDKEKRKCFLLAQMAIEKNDIAEVKKNIERFPEIVEEIDYTYGTLLHLAAYKGTPEMIEYLVNRGSNIDRIERSWSPICSAVVRDRVDNVKKLIELGAKLDNSVSESNPLTYAISHNNEEIAKLLIDGGIDLTIQFYSRNKDWWDLLSHSKFCNCKNIYNMILDKMKQDGIDYDSISPMPEKEENQEEYEEIVLPDIYEKNLGKIAKIYNESDLQKKIYNGRISLISDLDDFDIAVIMPDENRDYITLATLGMSAVSMAETDEGEKFAELIMKLPSHWDVSEEGLLDMTNNWPFRMMIKTAHLAHKFEGQYIDESIVIPSGNPNDAVLYFDGDSELSSVMLCKSEDMKPLKVDDTMTIDFFTLVPVTEEEGKLVGKISSDEIKKKLPKGEIVDLTRKYLV